MRLVRLPEVCELTGLSRSSLYRAINSGLFPKSVQLGERSVAWRIIEVEDWINTRPQS